MELKQFNDYQLSLLPFGDPAITKDDLWDIEFIDSNKKMLEAASYYIDTLENQKGLLDVPVGLIFSADREVNAKATIYNGKGLIVWNAGLLHKQLEMESKEEEIKHALAGGELDEILRYLDNTPGKLFMQSLQHFTFHHELAHIIQMQNKKQETILTNNPQADFQQNRHKLELNADEFSCLFLASHIDQYAQRIFEKPNEKQFSKLVSLFLVPILTDSVTVYNYQLSPAKQELGLHPHPITRLLFSALAIINVINQRYEGKFKLGYKKVLDDSLEVASKLTRVNLKEIWINQYQELMDYYQKILNLLYPKDYLNPLDVWNELIEKEGKNGQVE